MASSEVPVITSEEFYFYDGPNANRANTIALALSSLLSIPLLVFPFRSFIQHKNVPAASICAIIGILCLTSFVNACIWPNDNWRSWWQGFGLCDIEALLRFPLTVAFNRAMARLVMKLACALDVSSARLNPTSSMRRRAILIDLAWCWVIPILQLPLKWLVQAGRYGIIPVFGCVDQLDSDWLSILIIYIWAPIASLVAMVYAALLFYRCRKHRHDVRKTLSSSGSGMTEDFFWKLLLLATVFLIIYIPAQLSFIIRATPTQLESYDLHRIYSNTWGDILFFHTVDAPIIQYNGWAYIGCTVLLFIFFGFNDDALDEYHEFLGKLFGRWYPSLMEPRMRRSTANPHWANLVAKLVRRSRKLNAAYEQKKLQESCNSSTSRQDSLATTTVTDDGRPASTASSHHSFLSTFRTTLFPPFSRSAPRNSNNNSAKTITTTTTISTLTSPHVDLEAQNATYGEGLAPKVAVQTQVWSSPHLGVASGVKKERKKDDGEGEESDTDPLSPQRGTRDYRERERREEIEMGKMENKAAVEGEK